MTLVVTADDLGLSPGVTRGILEAHRDGIVRSTSLLVTFPAAEEAASLALAEHDLEIGLHIDLVGGMPVSDAGEIPSLVDGEGRLRALGDFTGRLLTGRVRADDVAREVRAQVELARSWGVPALAWDSHRHVHLMPPVARVVGHLARELGARWVRRGRALRQPLAAKSAAIHAASFLSELAYRKVPGNRWFVDLSAARPRLDATGVALLAASGGLGEVAAHPGYADDELRRSDWLVEDRELDLTVLTDPLLREALGRDCVVWRVRS